MSTLYSVGQMNQLGDALEEAGYEPGDVTKLRSSPALLVDLKLVLLGGAKVQPIKHSIDCDAVPKIPSDLQIKSHIKGGQFVFEPAKVTLYLSKKQQNEDYVNGNDLRKELRRKPVLNANVLDYLLKNTYLIPEEWRDKYVSFWGTIYCHRSHDLLYVRCLCFGGNRWNSVHFSIDRELSGLNHAAVRAS